MPTLTKETALFKPNQISNDITTAGQKADHYIKAVVNNTGLMIADMRNGSATPETETGRNVLIDSDSVDIRDGQDILASFGEEVVIGKKGERSLEFSNGEMTFYDDTHIEIMNVGSTAYEYDGSSIDYVNKEIETVLSYSFLGNPVHQSETSPTTDDITVTIRIYTQEQESTDYKVGFTYGESAQKSAENCLIEYNGQKTIAITNNESNLNDIHYYLHIVEYFTRSILPSFKFGPGAVAAGNNACAFGFAARATGDDSFAAGNHVLASGDYSHAEGKGNTRGSNPYAYNLGGTPTTASGDASHAEGYGTIASGYASHAEGASEGGGLGGGITTTASGDYSHAEGLGTTASGYASHSQGCRTEASGDYSHAEGGPGIYANKGIYKYFPTTAKGNYSHAQNLGTTADSDCQTTMGKYNESDTVNEIFTGDGEKTIFEFSHPVSKIRKVTIDYIPTNDYVELTSYSIEFNTPPEEGADINVQFALDTYALIIGNGSMEGGVLTRSNAFAVDWNGIPYARNPNNDFGSIFDLIYPVGSIYMSVNSTSPAVLFGGAWQRIQGKFLLGATVDGTPATGTNIKSNASVAAGSSGGEASHTLTQNELASHAHTINHNHSSNPITVSGGSHTHQTGFLVRGRYSGEADTRMGPYGPNSSGITGSVGTSATAHTHTVSGGGVIQHNGSSGNTGSGNAHNNMPPFLAVYIWQRTQ